MKVIKPRPHCAECGDLHVLLRCNNSMLNGCPDYLCLLCWPAHSKEHEWEWNGLTDVEQQRIIDNYDV